MARRASVDEYGLDLLTQQQDGLVTYSQLVQLGLPPATIGHRIRTGGPWQRLFPGTYLAFTGEPSWRHYVRGGLLYAGPRSMLTGLTVLRLCGFKDAAAADIVHVLISHDRRRLSRGTLRVERTTRLPRSTQVQGLPCGGIARAVVDGCRFLRRRNTVRAIAAHAVQAGHASVAELAREVGAAARPGTALLRQVVEELRIGLRSAAEADLKDLIRSAALPEPLWNVALYGRNGEFIAVPDGYFEDYGVAVEVNSREHHYGVQDWEATQRRQMRLSTYGIVVLPVTPRRIKQDSLAVAKEIRSSIERNHGRPRPDVIIGSAGQRSSP